MTTKFRDQAIKTGMNVLSGTYINIHKSWLRPDSRDLSTTPIASVDDVRDGRGYQVAFIPKEVQNLINAHLEIPNHLLVALQAYGERNHLIISEVYSSLP